MDDDPNKDDFHKVPYDDFESKEIGVMVIIAVGILLLVGVAFLLRVYGH